jgi:hypothetical protein
MSNKAALVLWLTMLGIPAELRAEWFAGGFIGAAVQAHSNDVKSGHGAHGGFWLTPRLAVEGRVGGIRRACHGVETTRHSSVSTETVGVVFAPNGHRGSVRPYGSISFGSIFQLVDGKLPSGRSF